jgi:hypothetical protein
MTQWWGATNSTEFQSHPLANFSYLQKSWHNLTTNIDWQASGGYIGSVGILPSSHFGLKYWAQSGHPSSCFPLDKVKNWESQDMKKN